MTIQPNAYPGVNAHLNSLLQSPGTAAQPALWATFHSRLITYLCDFLNEVLPDNYVAFSEHSLQTRGDDWGGEIVVSRLNPDVTVLQQAPSQAWERAPVPQPVLTLTIEETIDPELRLSAILIRETEAQNVTGVAVTRIELLSPANKPGGSKYAAYISRRIEALESGLPLIEIDLLHETPSPLRNVPVYPHAASSKPYYVALSDPHPGMQQGKVGIFNFHTGEVIPKLPIPLANDETIVFDLNRVYQHTFTAGRWYKFVDYAQEPVRIETYSPDDQARIRQIMAQAG
jgi:hypothetical protein